MRNLLFINACVRGEAESRTFELSKAFLDAYLERNSGVEVARVDLSSLGLLPFSADMLKQRDGLLGLGQLDHPMLKLARQFARADEILVAAPYWDLSFPAVFKAYVEHVSVAGITFAYTETGATKGICQAKKLMYITTVGGFLGEFDFGFQYVEGLCRFFGIGPARSFSLEGLDILGADIPGMMREGKAKIAEIAAAF